MGHDEAPASRRRRVLPVPAQAQGSRRLTAATAAAGDEFDAGGVDAGVGQGRRPRRLIVTADDFGAAVAVNAAVERAHRDGIVSAASLMISGDAAADAVLRARALPGLGVGLHLVLVEGRSTLPPDRIPGLIGANGRLRTDLARFGWDVAFKPSVRAQLADEIEAQFAAFARTGLTLDHVNAHKHIHVHPTIVSLVAGIGRRYGLRAARAPVEPISVLRTVERVRRPATALVSAPWARMTARRFARAGLTVPDQVFGVAWSGAMTRDRLRGLLRQLPEGLTEIYAHPATADTYPGHAPGYRYRDELAALTDTVMRGQLERGGIALGSFARFVPPAGVPAG